MSRRLTRASFITLVGAIVTVTMVGCGGGGTGSGTGTQNASLGVAATGATTRPAGGVSTADVAVPPLLVVSLPNGLTVEIDQAFVGVTKVDLETADEVEAEEGEDSGGDEEDGDQEEQAVQAEDDDGDFGGPYIADIVNERLLNPDGTVADDVTASYPPGTVLEEAEVECDAVAGVCPVNPSNPVTVHVHGTIRDAQGEVVYSFHLDSNATAELEFGDDTPGGVIVGDDNLFQIVFALDQWFAGVDPGAANVSLVDGNGDVIFDGANNTALQAAIVANILQRIKLDDDDDHDGEPDEGEDDDF